METAVVQSDGGGGVMETAVVQSDGGVGGVETAVVQLGGARVMQTAVVRSDGGAAIWDTARWSRDDTGVSDDTGEKEFEVLGHGVRELNAESGQLAPAGTDEEENEAGFRSTQARREPKMMEAEEEGAAAAAAGAGPESAAAEEEGAAATRLQSHYRGHQARKEFVAMRAAAAPLDIDAALDTAVARETARMEAAFDVHTMQLDNDPVVAAAAAPPDIDAPAVAEAPPDIDAAVDAAVNAATARMAAEFDARTKQLELQMLAAESRAEAAESRTAELTLQMAPPLRV